MPKMKEITELAEGDHDEQLDAFIPDPQPTTTETDQPTETPTA